MWRGRWRCLEPYRDQIATWLDQDHLLLTRIQELLDTQHRVKVKYTTLRRYVRQAGLWKQPRSTVRMAPTAPGEVAEMDFGKLGTLINPDHWQAPGRVRAAGGTGVQPIRLCVAAGAADGRGHDRRVWSRRGASSAVYLCV